MLEIFLQEAGYPSKTRLGRAHVTRILSQIQLTIQPGEIVALVGESGCGKSTLGLSLVGLIPHVKGQVNLDGEIINLESPSAQMRRIQYVFQDPLSALNPRMTIGQTYSELVQQMSGEAERGLTAREMITEVELTDDVWYKYPHELSGGQCQRVNIGRALLRRPAYLICDEIVSALDVSVQAKILNLLQKLVRQEKLGILFTTHDLHVVRSFAGRVFIMKDGEIIENGATEDVFANPRHQYTIDLLSAAYPLRNA